MTLLFLESFDHCAAAELTYKWNQIVNGSGGITLVPSRTGSANAAMTTGTAYIQKAGFNVSTMIIGFAWKTEGTDSNNRPLLQLMNLTTFIEGLCITGSGSNRLGIYTNTNPANNYPSPYVVSTKALYDNTWYYIEVKLTKAGAGGGSVVVRVNGEVWINATGLSNAGSVTDVQFGRRDKSLYDDIYICDTAGSTNNDFLGDLVVECLKPNGVGNSSQWTPLGAGDNYEEVDEDEPDEDTSYVSSDTAGNKDTYEFDNLTTVNGTIYGIFTNILARKTHAGISTLRRIVRSGGADYEGSDAYIGNSYTYYPEVSEVDPDTSAAWTISSLNAAQFGVKHQS